MGHETGSWRNRLPLLGLAAVVVSFVYYAVGLPMADKFGWYHDDSLYFSSAQALAHGRGYIMPSVPETPPQTKYPILYPWVLSWIWKWQPAFPANVATASRVTIIFACWFLVVVFLLVRKLADLGDWAALMVVSVCAFKPLFVVYSRAVLSDMPFMALAFTAALLADAALRPQARLALTALAGLLAGLSVMTRTLGIAVVAGIAAAAFFRRLPGRAILFLVVALPFAAAVLGWSLGRQSQSMSGGDLGWQETWFFYTSYVQFWKISVPSVKVLLAMLASNLGTFLAWPGSFSLFPPLGNSHLGSALSVTFTAGILAGLVRQARRHEWKPIHFIFAFYSAAILAWNYPLMDRFLLPFLPLFYVGLWVEFKHIGTMARQNLRLGSSLATKTTAGALALALAAVGVLALDSYSDEFRAQLRGRAPKRVGLAEEKNELYDWIRRNTRGGDRFVADEDVCLYLFTGRQALRPIVFSTESFFASENTALLRELDHITDVARRIAAQYWVTTPEDFAVQDNHQRILIGKRMGQLKSVLPLVFESRSKKVQVFALSCLHQPEAVPCRAAAPVIFSATLQKPE
jgi:hypothetical protein